MEIKDDGSVYLDGRLLHPGGQALEAARREVAGLVSELSGDDVVLLAGAGLGWHAKALAEAPGGPRVVAYEPDPLVTAMRLCLGPFLPELETAGDPEALARALAGAMVYGPGRRLAVFSPPAYREARPEVEQDALGMVRQTSARSRSDRLTRLVRKNEWLDHLEANFRQLLEVPDLTQLVGALSGIPALVVGAGPSLDRTLPLLRDASRRALVLAAASAIGPLTRLGSPPQIAVALEAKDESRQFAGADFSRTLLAAATSGHPNHFRAWGGLRGLFHLQSWLPLLTGLGQVLPTGGHATSAAFSLALLFGCDPIILVGQDLAYTDGRIHASGRPGGEDEGIPDMVEVPAIGGGTARTSEIMLSYLNWYQESADYLRRKHPDRRVINATAAGAEIAGFLHLPLEEVWGELPTLQLDTLELFRALSRLPKPGASYLSLRLAEARAGVRRALGVLAAEGLEAARRGAKEDTAAGAALADLSPEAGPEEAQREMDSMINRLGRMQEALGERT